MQSGTESKGTKLKERLQREWLLIAHPENTREGFLERRIHTMRFTMDNLASSAAIRCITGRAGGNTFYLRAEVVSEVVRIGNVNFVIVFSPFNSCPTSDQTFPIAPIVDASALYRQVPDPLISEGAQNVQTINNAA